MAYNARETSVSSIMSDLKKIGEVLFSKKLCPSSNRGIVTLPNSSEKLYARRYKYEEHHGKGSGAIHFQGAAKWEAYHMGSRGRLLNISKSRGICAGDDTPTRPKLRVERLPRSFYRQRCRGTDNAGYKWIKKDVVKRENELLRWAEKEWAD